MPESAASPACRLQDGSSDAAAAALIESPRRSLPAYYSLPSHVFLKQQLVSAFLSFYPLPSSPFPLPLVDSIVEYAWQPELTHSREMINATVDAEVAADVERHNSGLTHADTRQWDDWSEELRQLVLRGWKLQQVTALAARHCHGLTVTYAHPSDPTRTVCMPSHCGSQATSAVASTLTLAADEHLVQVSFLYSEAFDMLTFTTSAGRSMTVGGGGLSVAELKAQHSAFGYALQDSLIDGEVGSGRILALRGGGGAALHNIGAVYESMYPRPTLATIRARDPLRALEQEQDNSTRRTAASQKRRRRNAAVAGRGWLQSLLCWPW